MNNTTKPITIIRQKLQKIMTIIIINAILEIFSGGGGLSTQRITVGDQNGTVGFPISHGMVSY